MELPSSPNYFLPSETTPLTTLPYPLNAATPSLVAYTHRINSLLAAELLYVWLMNFMHGHSSSCGRRHGQPSSFGIVSQMQLSTNPKIYCHGGPWAGYIHAYPLLFAGHWYMDMNLRCHSFFVFLWAMLILRLRLPILNLRISRLTTSTLIYALSEPTKLNGHNRISDREPVFHPTLGYEIWIQLDVICTHAYFCGSQTEMHTIPRNLDHSDLAMQSWA